MRPYTINTRSDSARGRIGSSKRSFRSRKLSSRSWGSSSGSKRIIEVELKRNGNFSHDSRKNYINLAYERVHPDGYERIQTVPNTNLNGSIYGQYSGYKPQS
jgi:hypothetical protein